MKKSSNSCFFNLRVASRVLKFNKTLFLVYKLFYLTFCQQNTQNELDEQEQRLQRLHRIGKDIMDGADNSDDVTKEIKAQLQDFDDCWNHVAKRTLEEKEKVRNILVQCYPWTAITDSGDTAE